MATAARLTHKQFLKIDRDYSKAAELASLNYVSDTDLGILRTKKGTRFAYTLNGKKVTDEQQLQRIKSLVIPPAWTQVWICTSPAGHIQATGYDVRGRKQYRYHHHWHQLRNETKFHRMYEFGRQLLALRQKLEDDFAEKNLTEQKVLATVVSLMERTYIRVGNNDYEKMYGSYGLTTLKDKHVTIKGDNLKFSFKGKKGVYHEVPLRHRKLAKVVQACRDIPGKELFQYYTGTGEKRSIDSGMVNRYIKEATGQDFTAKDFRTWAGTINILQSFKSLGEAQSEAEKKKNVIQALDEVSAKLGNTRTVCKKYYVHPGIIRMYEEQGLAKYLKELDAIENKDDLVGYTTTEKVLMKILEELV